MIDFKKENISVIEYCLHHTDVGDMVDIYDSGYYVASCIIDSEDLFARNMSGDYTREYIDSVDVSDRVVTDKNSYGVVTTHKCKCHCINIGYSTTNFKRFRVRMKTPGGIKYTQWYSKSDSVTINDAIKESDEMLKGCHNWSRAVEYERIFND